MVATSYIIENDEAFQRGLNRLSKATQDFRIPFGLISKDFYRDEKKIFSLKGPGKYPVLGSDSGGGNAGRVLDNGAKAQDFAETRKERRVGFVYPLLFATGRLASSLLSPNDPEAVHFIGKKVLELGTDVPYAKFHQDGTKHLPERKVVFIDGGPLETSRGASTAGRRERWLNIMNTYILDLIKEGVTK